ncbi:MAG TPA: hypothetical protein VGG72_13805 [Bryobacteraceae bacterium]
MPKNCPFQFVIGMATQIRTLSFSGGWVVIAVIRQTAELLASTVADSIVVLGKTSVAKLSQVRTGFAFGMAGFGVLPNGGCAPRPAAGGVPFAAGPLAPP